MQPTKIYVVEDGDGAVLVVEVGDGRKFFTPLQLVEDDEGGEVGAGGGVEPPIDP